MGPDSQAVSRLPQAELAALVSAAVFGSNRSSEREVTFGNHVYHYR
jgi:hypothetical protein